MRLVPAYGSRTRLRLTDHCTCGHPGYAHNRISSMHSCFQCERENGRLRHFRSNRIVAEALHALFPTD